MAKQVDSLRSYATHRGVSVEAVSKAVESGRLKASVERVGSRVKIKDFAAADKEWDENTEHAMRPGTAEPGVRADGGTPQLARSIAAVRLLKERANLELANLDLAERKGELISRADHRAALAAAIVPRMTRVLGVPTALRQALPHLSLEDVGVAERLLRESLAGEDDAPDLEAADLDVLEAWCAARRAELAGGGRGTGA